MQTQVISHRVLSQTKTHREQTIVVEIKIVNVGTPEHFICSLCQQCRPSAHHVSADIGQPTGTKICIDCLTDYEVHTARPPAEPLPYEFDGDPCDTVREENTNAA